jgi:hypothetical protein
MNESAFHFCGRWILITTVFHFPKSTSTGGIPDFFRVCILKKFIIIHSAPKKTFSEFICGRWYSSTRDDLKNAFSRSTIHFFLLYNSNKINSKFGLINWKNLVFCRLSWKWMSLADNWDLVEFFERFICGRWYIHLEQPIYHIYFGRLSSPVVDYNPISSPVVDCKFKNQPS